MNDIPCRVTIEENQYQRNLCRALEEYQLDKEDKLKSHMAYMRFMKKIKNAKAVEYK